MADRSLKDMDSEKPWQFMKYFLTSKHRLFKYQEGSKEQLSGYEAVEVTDVYGGKYAMLEKYERAGMPWNPSGKVDDGHWASILEVFLSILHIYVKMVHLE